MLAAYPDFHKQGTESFFYGTESFLVTRSSAFPPSPPPHRVRITKKKQANLNDLHVVKCVLHNLSQDLYDEDDDVQRKPKKTRRKMIRTTSITRVRRLGPEYSSDTLHLYMKSGI